MAEASDKGAESKRLAAEREARLAQALRDNLRRRKQTARKPAKKPSED